MLLELNENESKMMMDELRIAIIGFGSANRALARMLLDKSESPTTNPDSPLYDNRLRLRIGARLVPWRIVCIILQAKKLKSQLDSTIARAFPAD